MIISSAATTRRAVVKRPLTSAGCSTLCEPSALIVVTESRFGRFGAWGRAGTGKSFGGGRGPPLQSRGGRREILRILADNESGEFDNFDRRHLLAPGLHAGSIVAGTFRRSAGIDQLED